jgi:hypothetical protein
MHNDHNWTNKARLIQEHLFLSFADWRLELERNVKGRPYKITDPLRHVEDQIKNTLATTIKAFCSTAFGGLWTDNAFALMGCNFIVDKNLNVWLTELNDHPSIWYDHDPVKHKVHDAILPQMADVVEEVMTKQTKGNPLLPLKSVQTFELIYRD